MSSDLKCCSLLRMHSSFFVGAFYFVVVVVVGMCFASTLVKCHSLNFPSCGFFTLAGNYLPFHFSFTPCSALAAVYFFSLHPFIRLKVLGFVLLVDELANKLARPQTTTCWYVPESTLHPAALSVNYNLNIYNINEVIIQTQNYLSFL